ncbi:hypothetical protein NEUTE1DRAFT_133455 [Neurospora tetrasperma FGSC 2508]|uniref:Helicase-associated domain-containing protein n=1 Tax=Neurospora tetrasperma (strain FGSC 2508 / ATCC MYA-4615 / P0657) TaxID=510951 RepID=F8MZZ0_NEUT8|nr:uncharacterized protein NEUTE1DRAFT_133455 [Neurospora tetrasperma FGSC 2508]EGO52925.1 hypothetical protein NEUTE1DRAFT_133455 [Neurospora tetrasperma FGSC 2508]
MGRDDNEDRSFKRRKIDFNPLRSDDRFSDLPSRTPHKGPRGANGNNGSFNSRASTPRVGSRYSGGETPRQKEFDGPEPGVNDDDATNALDRDWYGGDDDLGGHTFGDDSHNPFGDEGAWAAQEREAALAEKKIGQMARGMSVRQIQKQKDADAWETNRMLTSGVAQRRDLGQDFEDDQEGTRVHLLVHDLRPPFLDGRTIFTKQLDPVPAVRDSQSDMAIFARKGSKVVRERRTQRERQRQAQEATKVAGTALGNLMGVKEEDTDSALPIAVEEEAGKSKNMNKFSEHMKENEGASNFSQSKSLKEQREFLPAFASLGVKDLLDFDFMDPPPQDTISTSLFDLWALGALDNLGELTDLGRKMNAFPMDPPLAKLLITSEEYGCSEEMVTIVSMLSVPNVFYRPKERQEESDAAREKFFVPESDHLTYLHVYTQWKANGYNDGWCVRHFLHSKSLRRAKEVREQLLDIMKMQNMKMMSCGTDWDVIRKCICSGYYHQAAKVKGIGEYINLRTSVTVQLHPTSALYGLGFLPDYVVYHELILTSKEYMSTVTSVDPHWLADLGGVFYSVKEKGYSAREKRITETEFNRKMEIEARMAADKKRQEDQLHEEELQLEKKAAPSKDKKVVKAGAVVKPVRKRAGRGF